MPRTNKQNTANPTRRPLGAAAKPAPPGPVEPAAAIRSEKITIRRASLPDTLPIMTILERTGFFRPGELDVAKEVFREALENKPGCTYRSFIAVYKNRPAGWICFGPTPCATGTFDIYWIAVDPSLQRKHIGSRLIGFACEQITSCNGRLMVIETSGSQRYQPTRSFYLKNGFQQAACVRDFYAPGDDKLIYTRAVVSETSQTP